MDNVIKSNMKIVIVNGQNHKGSTYHAGRMLAEKLGGDIMEFFLPKDFGEFCVGCTQCFSKSEEFCPHYKKLSPITKAIDDADLLILASPVYVYHCTGAMKAFLDHYGWRWIVHRPEEKMFSKRAVVVSTAAGAGMSSTNKDMKDSLVFWGVPKVYKLGFAVMETRWEHVSDKKKAGIDKKTSRLANRLKADSFKPKVSLKARLFFTGLRIVNKKGGFNPADSEYWKAKGWTEKIRPWKS